LEELLLLPLLLAPAPAMPAPLLVGLPPPAPPAAPLAPAWRCSLASMSLAD
jgi:hypothetical protein